MPKQPSRAKSFQLDVRGHRFRAVDTRLVRFAAGEFLNGCEEGTLQFFDAVLPRCDRMVDCGAYIGFTALYAATQVAEVHAIEPSPSHHALLAANVAVNPDLAPRLRLRNHALGDRDGEVTLYRKALADSGTSIFRTVQRGAVISGQSEATVPIRNAAEVLTEIGIDRRTLVKIDIEGAEYQVVPTIQALLAATRPFVHVSFHPFNIVVSDDDYVNAVGWLRGALAVAEALAHYQCMYFFDGGSWTLVAPPDRVHFLRHYLLAPKPVPRIATPQYGFVDAVGFSDEPLDALR